MKVPVSGNPSNGNKNGNHEIRNALISYDEAIVNGLSVLNVRYSNGSSAKIGKICGRLISWCDHKNAELLSVFLIMFDCLYMKIL